MTAPPSAARALIDELVRSTGAPDPITAVRLRAERAVEAFVQVFGEPEEMPLDLMSLASFLGIKQSEATPTFSPDAEIAPDGEGGVEMRLNPDRPETRQRFSIGHEITHTFFPDHASHVWPRADSRYRDLRDPNDYLEMLCDAGAAELVFPRRWFVSDAAAVRTAADLVALARRYKASREATLRRYAELHPEAAVAVVFTWRLKPSQKSTVGNTAQGNLFGLDSKQEAIAARRLRVEYTIPSSSFSASGHHVPRDKSVACEGPLYEASLASRPQDATSDLDLGPASGRYEVQALPLWTPDDERGPSGECAIAAILKPVEVRRPRRKSTSQQSALFQ